MKKRMALLLAAITSAAKQKRQTIYRLHGQIIWRWL